MIKTKLMFPNFGGKTHEQSLAENLHVSKLRTDVIHKIMQENNYVKEDHDPRVRLFHLGMELQDSKTLKEYYKGEESNNELIIHVFISFQKSKKSSATSSKKEKKGDSLCNCALF